LHVDPGWIECVGLVDLSVLSLSISDPPGVEVETPTPRDAAQN